MTRTNDLFTQVAAWADEKGILQKSTAINQVVKTAEEIGELFGAVAKNDIMQIKLEAGDVLVTLAVQCELLSAAEYISGCIDIKLRQPFRPYTTDATRLLFLLSRECCELYNGYRFNARETTIYSAMLATIYPVLDIVRLFDLDPLDCLEASVNKITKRTGRMVGGVFVKDAP